MRRRALLTMLGGALAAASRRGWAQQTGQRRPVVAYLGGSSPTVIDPQYLDGLREGLRENGLRDGDNVTVLYRWAEGRADGLDVLARDVVAERPDVLITAGPQLIRALQQATQRIPIVMAVDADPVADGFVDSFAHPGHNITGLSLQNADMMPKRLQLLRDMLPGLQRVAVVLDTSQRNDLPAPAAAPLGLELEMIELAPGDIAGALRTHPGLKRVQAVLVGASPFINFNRKLLIELFADVKLPASYEERGFARDGGLLSYGPSFADMYRRSAGYVAKILAGAGPADLPIEQPTKFELVVNLGTARKLGLAVPPSLLTRADQVIE